MTRLCTYQCLCADMVCFAKVGVEEFAQSPDLKPTKHLWDELECRLHTMPPLLTSLRLLSERAEIQNVVKSLPSRVETISATNRRPTSY